MLKCPKYAPPEIATTAMPGEALSSRRKAEHHGHTWIHSVAPERMVVLSVPPAASVVGVIMALGLGMMSGQMTVVSFWSLKVVPTLGRIG